MLRTFLFSAALSIACFPVQAADQARVLEIVTGKCQICHGQDGESSSAIYPRLAGQNASYISKQLADFKEGRRKGTMNEMAADLTPEEMHALGEYFSQKPVQAHKASDPDLTAVGKYIYHKGNKWSGVAACASCHGDEGSGTADLPRLAGQHMRYLISQLQDFNDRERNNDNAIMHSIASKLTELEVEAVSRYLSGK